jgi:DNA-binding LytR/AlgR family response regulator
MQFWSLFQAPYPHSNEPRSILKSSGIMGGVVAVVLFLVQTQFGIYTMPYQTAFLMALQYGAITAAMTLILAFVAAGLQSSWFDEQKWTVGKEILFVMLHLAVIAGANMIYTKLRYPGQVQGFPYLQWVGVTCLIGLAPVTASVLFNQYRWFKRNRAEAAAISDQIPQKQVDTPAIPASQITLTGDNQGEILEMDISDFIYAESADNYVVVHYLQRETQTNQIITPSANFILRSTLKRIALQLKDHPQVKQCHRSFLVNTHHINSADGNAAGLRLTLAHGGAVVPVSRGMVGQIRP